jgi:hypothetical protein
MRPDDVCERYAGRNAQVGALPARWRYGADRGDRSSLEFLAELIQAQARLESDTGFSIRPNGAGRVFFKKGSELGIYLHRKDSQERRPSRWGSRCQASKLRLRRAREAGLTADSQARRGTFRSGSTCIFSAHLDPRGPGFWRFWRPP